VNQNWGKIIRIFLILANHPFTWYKITIAESSAALLMLFPYYIDCGKIENVTVCQNTNVYNKTFFYSVADS
jgi:hypothetical protein